MWPGSVTLGPMPDADVTERLAALEQRLDRLEAILTQRYVQPPRAAQPPPPRVAVVPPAVRPSLEQAIGLRWAGWAGAIACVVGAALGIEFAYRQGWFQVVSPAMRVMALVAVAGALIGVGEWVYRRVNPWSAVGPFATGVAVLFLAAYAGQAFYGLYGRPTAFAFMVTATIVGAAVARRGDLVSIAAVSIVGGNLAPWLLRGDVPRPGGFFAYLLAMELIAVGLAWRGGRKWWVLRGLSLATTAVWVAAVLPLPPFVGVTTVAFLVAFAAVYHAERIASAAVAVADDAEAAGSVAFGCCVTAALAAGLLFLSRSDPAAFRTAEVLAMAAAAAVLAFATRRGGAGLRATAAGFVVQSAGLVVLAVPVATSGGSVAIGWGLLAVGLAVAGRWSRAAAMAAPLVWMFSVGDLVLWAEGFTGDGRAGRTLFAVAGRAVPAYAAAAWALAVGGHAVATLTRRRDRVEQGDGIAALVDTVSALTFVAASLVALPTTAGTTACVAYAAAVTVAAATGVLPASVATAVAVFVAVKWMAADTVVNRPASGATAPTAALGGAIVAVLVGAGWANRGRADRVGRAVRVFAVVAGVWAASVAIDAALAGGRASALAEQVALSVLWAAAATAVVAAGFARRLPELRYAGLALFAVTAVKVVAVDLAHVGTGWRILSFLGLGGLLLATSVLYGHLGDGKRRPVGPAEPR